MKDAVSFMLLVRSKRHGKSISRVGGAVCFLWTRFFLHRNLAYIVAQQSNRVDIGHPNIGGLQICYYEGDVFEDAPVNLVNISSSDLVDFFTHTRLRLPALLVTPPGLSEQDKQELREAFKQLRKTVLMDRDALGRDYLMRCKSLEPPR